MNIIFNQHPEVKAGLSERVDGSMIWRNQLPVDETVKKNREKYFKSLDINPARVVTGGVAHGSHVAVVGEKEAGQYLLNTDALVTNQPNLFLSVTAADCLPVFYFDSATKSVGMAHAGWRGLVAGILENVVTTMQKNYGTKPEDLLVIIGPHIQSCHYEVGAEVAAKFAKENIEERAGHLFAKLADEAVSRLNKMGVKNVTISPVCTYHQAETLYSARYDKTEPLQGMLTYIGIK